MKRTLVAIASVLLVCTPIGWILVQQPDNEADASVPYVDRQDDTYITASNEPVVVTESPAVPKTVSPTPGPSGTPTPGETATPGTPSTSPTDGPTTAPTDGPTTSPTGPPRNGSSTGPKPGKPTTVVPSETPSDDGSMDDDELQLFSLIDNARRTEKGCAPLRRNSSLSDGAGSEAQGRAESGEVSATGSSKASAGGDDMSAQTAFDRLMDQSSGTLLNCGLNELGVGQGSATRKEGLCPLICSTNTRFAWVVAFN